MTTDHYERLKARYASNKDTAQETRKTAKLGMESTKERFDALVGSVTATYLVMASQGKRQLEHITNASQHSLLKSGLINHDDFQAPAFGFADG